MKIAFVRVLGRDRYDSNTADHNVGLGYLAAVAKLEGATPIILDPYDPLKETRDDILLESKYNIVGFTVHYMNVEKTLEIAQLIKIKFPETIIVLGGHHVSTTATEILNDHAYIDAVCVGEGEDVIKKMISKLRKGETATQIRKKGIFTPSSYPDLDRLPFPIRNTSLPIARISTSRGCPYSCTFCTTPALRDLIKEPTYRSRSASSVVDEMEELYSNGVRNVHINDDLYAMPNPGSHARVSEIADELLKRNIQLEYKTQLRVDSFSLKDFQLLQHLKRSGLKSVFIGVESGNDSILEEYDKRITVSQCIHILNMYHQVGIEVNSGNILASPNSNLEEICDSIKGFHRMGTAYLFFRRVTFRAHVFPGTVLERRLENEKRLENKPRYLPRDYTFLDPRIDEIVKMFETIMPDFLKDIGAELFQLRNKALKLYYSRQNRDDESKLMPIFSEWNDKSAQLLLNWFDDSSTRKLETRNFRQEFAEYTNFARETKAKLANFVEMGSEG